MYEGKTRTLFVRYAIPQMIGLLFNSVYMIVDGVFIGNVLGRDSMAAAAVAVPLIEILIALSMAVASGAGILISGLLAQQEKQKALEVFDTALLSAAAIGALVAAGGNLFLDPLAEALGATAQIHAQATEYIRYIVTFSPFLLFSFLLSGLARNDGCPRLAMAALAVGSVSNIVLDYVFMCPLHMGIGGAALATAIGPVLSVLILLPHFLRKTGALYFSVPRVRAAYFWRIAALGVPSFVMEFTIGILTFVYNIAIVRYGYGEIGLAAYLVIGYLMLLFLTLFLGMAEGLQPVFSYFTGAGAAARCRALRRFATVVFLTVGIVCYGGIVLFSHAFFALFNPGDLELIRFAADRSLPYFCGFFLAGYNILMISFWQSTQRTGHALLISLSRSVLVLPLLVAVLPLLWGGEMLWLCHSLSEALTAALAFALHRRQSGAKAGIPAGGVIQ